MLPRYGMGSFTSLRDGVNECLPRGWRCIMFLSKIMMNLKRIMLSERSPIKKEYIVLDAIYIKFQGMESYL